jgi:hypothetical protein
VGFTNAMAMKVQPGQVAKVTTPVVEETAQTAVLSEVQRTASS